MPLVGSLLERLFPDPADAGQVEVNKVEAAGSSLFVAGWRPAVGWVCVAAFGYHYVVMPAATWTVAAIGHQIPALTVLDGNLFELMLGMLGIGGLRTWEKMKGGAR